MGKKIILVTGSNKGIGFEVVRQLAKLGHQVILTARDEAKGLEALKKLKTEGLNVQFIPLDVTNEKSIQQAASKVKSDFGKLDVLINNAAISLRGDHSLLTNDSAITEQIINTNALAQLAVTRAFQSLIPNGGRIIMISSGGGSMSDPVGGWSPAYCVSKSFLGAITRHLAYEFSSRKISVNALDPGWVKTDMGGRSAPGSVEEGADTPVWLATTEKIATGKFFRNRKEIPW
ncbi:MAG TPA: SDR family oxidoreductase [Cyclobacteriaceae bacterium]|jgi:NAD(P)-dependent dehydrogenase (short-subunit alcohol dehydrogenase family)|nr:SDR family oxidoreductase [Cyclobacteriaceae bacterium]